MSKLLSNNPILVVERDRFKLFEEIIGRCMVLLLIGGSACVCLREISRAAVADIIFVFSFLIIVICAFMTV